MALLNPSFLKLCHFLKELGLRFLHMHLGKAFGKKDAQGQDGVGCMVLKGFW